MKKYDIFIFSQKGPKQLDKTHGIYYNVFDDNINDQSRLQNLVQAKILEGVVVATILGDTLVEF